MPLAEESTSRLESAAIALALAPIVLIPQAFGGMHPQVTLAATLVELVALALLLASKGRRRAPIVASWVGLPLAAGLAAAAVMILPLPRALRALLSPVATDEIAWATALLPEETRTSVAPVLSLDPPETAFAVLRLVGALALFLVLGDRVRHHRAATLAWRAIALSAWLLFLVALLHAVFRVDGAWGISVRYPGVFFAPLVNPNQLARVFGALSLACAGYATTVRGRRETFVFAGAALCCGAGTFLTLSRGGMVAYLAGALVLLVLLWRARRARAEVPLTWWRAALAPTLLVAVLGVSAFVAREAVVRQASSLADESIEHSKLQLYRPALALLADYGRVGIGPGAFTVAFTAASGPRHSAARTSYTHAENFAVQALVDHGLPVGVSLLVLALVVAVFLGSRARAAREAGPLAALAFLVIGDLFDFVLQREVGLLLAALLLALAGARAAEEGFWRAELRPRAAFALLILLGGALVWCAPTALGSWRQRVDRALDAAEPGTRASVLHEAVASHPRDAHYYYLLAVEARYARDPSTALAWANRAIVLSPTLRRAHVEAARALFALGRAEQALVQYKAAWLADERPDGSLAREIFSRTSDVGLRRRALPDTARDLALLCDALQREARHDDALACADEAATRPDAPPELRRRALELSLAHDGDEGVARRLELFLSDYPEGSMPDGADAVLHARALVALDGPAPARATAATWHSRLHDPVPLLQWRLSQAMKAQDLDEAEGLFALLRAASRTPEAVDRLDRLEAELAAKRGTPGKQLEILGRLLTRHPREVGLLVQRAHAELALEQRTAARASYEEAALLAPNHPAVRALRAKIERTEP